MSSENQSFFIQLDHSGTPRARASRSTIENNPFFEPGPVAEGAGDDASGVKAGSTAAEPTKVHLLSLMILL